jgi:hypothetical protein
MAKQAKRSAESWTYVLEADQRLPVEEQTRFTLKPMTGAERAQFVDDLVRTSVAPDGSQTVMRRTQQNARELCLTHIERIENFPAGSNGSAMAWPKSREEREAYLEQLSDDDVMELGNEVYVRSTAGPDAKNSLPLGHTSRSGGGSAEATSTTAPPAERA